MDIFNGFLEQYSGPPEPVDLIIMAGVAYYIPEKRKMVEQVMSWLKPEGHFIMVHLPPNTPIVIGQDSIRKLLMGICITDES